MKRFATYTLYTLLLATIVCACTDSLDIKQSYGYSVETLPLPKSLKKGQSVDLEFSILREGNYSGTSFRFRFFQSEGAGTLTDATGQPLAMNRYHAIPSDDFVLTYTCTAEEQQQLDFVFEDSFGQRVDYVISFTGARIDKPE